jgi:hypothetical protein
MGNSLFPMVSNIFKEYFEEITLNKADHKLPQIRRRFFRGLATWTSSTAAISSAPQQPQICHQIHNGVEANDILPFLFNLVMKRGPKLSTKLYWKLTHTGRYLHFKSNHPHHVKKKSRS